MFRLVIKNDSLCSLIYLNKYLEIKILNNNEYLLSCTKEEWNNIYKDYFDYNNNYEKYEKICNKEDVFLKKCIEYGSGLRILNQNKFETIISFIISQRKSVNAIRTSIERLCKICNKKHHFISPFTNEKITYYSFPSAKDIYLLKDENLNSCGLGYRKEYIKLFCKEVVEKKINFDKLNKLSDKQLIDFFMSFKGIGIKVASCIALFSYHRLSICPIDVWIERVINKEYNGKIPKSYNEYLGLIQQYWFNYARLQKLK